MKFFNTILLFTSLLFVGNATAQVGVGTTAPQGALDITSTTNGVLLPRVTLTALGTYAPVVNPATGLAPVTGTLVWNNAGALPAGFYYWNGTTWVAVTSPSGGSNWTLTGNAGTTVAANFLGTTDAQGLRIKTNNTDAFEISSGGLLRSFNDGTAALPAFSWNANNDMGLFRQGTSSLGFATGGLERVRIPNAFQIQAGSATPTGGNPAGSAAAPSFSFVNNTGAGMWSPTTGQLAFATNATEKMRITGGGQVGLGITTPQGALDITTSATPAFADGLLIPRVALSSAATATIQTPTVSELVYNTATAGAGANQVSPGFYFWNGTKWIRLIDSDSTKSGSGAATATLVEPNANIPGPAGSLALVGSDATAISFDATSITRTFNVTGLTGNTCNVTFSLKFDQDFMADVDAYLTSPTGQIIELTTDNGGSSSGTIQNFNVLFSDAGALNITSFTSGSVSGTYRPEGSLTPGTLTPNIQTMSGFNGFNPNGTWTLTLIDDAGINNLIYASSSLNIATYGPTTYRLIGETSITYKTGTNIITNTTYSGNPVDNDGVITALTRTTASAGAVGTTVATLPATILSYASDSPRAGSGNFWVTTHNQAISSGLVNGTTYFYQLWAKANIDTPISDNENFSIIPIMIGQ